MTAVEFLSEQIRLTNIEGLRFQLWDAIEQAKEMEKEQSYSEGEVIKFGQWLSEFNNLDNETEYVIKELLEQFKNK